MTKFLSNFLHFFYLVCLGTKLTLVRVIIFIRQSTIGLFKFFDYVVTFLFYLFTYFGIGLLVVSKFLYKYFIIIYNYALKPFILWLSDLFKFSVLGVFYILKIILYIVPKYLFSLVSSAINSIYNKLKEKFMFFKEWIVALPSKIKKYFAEKFDSLTIVKYYRQRKYADLEIMYIDKNSEDAERTEIKQTFRYVARSQEGKLVTGYFSAFSKLDCYSYLLDEKYEVYKIETNKWINFTHGDNTFFSAKMKTKDLIFWLTQLSTYIKSGVPLTDSVKILSEQDKRKKYKKTYDSLIYELTMGESFSKALEKQGSMFPGLLVNMIKAAEMIGDIESTLDEMAQYYSQIESNRKQVISALTYPAIVFVFSVTIITFILVYVIPKFVDVYSQAGVEMNSFTVLILNLSNFLVNNYIFLILGIVGIIIIYKVMMKNLKAFRTTMQYFYMHIPVVGKIMIYNEMVLFSKTFASLQKNNIMLTESIDILQKITNNEIYKLIMQETITNLVRGDKMSDSFKNNWAVPELAYYMITTGEKTGELANMLDKIADFYQEQQKTVTTALKSFIEPIMIAVLAVIVGAIILAVIVPMFGLYSSVAS